MMSLTTSEANALRTALRRAGYPRAGENLPALTKDVPLPVYRRAHRARWRIDRLDDGTPAAFIRDRVIARADQTDHRDDRLDSFLSVRLPVALHQRLRKAYGNDVSKHLRVLIEADLDARGIR